MLKRRSKVKVDSLRYERQASKKTWSEKRRRKLRWIGRCRRKTRREKENVKVKKLYFERKKEEKEKICYNLLTQQKNLLNFCIDILPRLFLYIQPRFQAKKELLV